MKKATKHKDSYQLLVAGDIILASDCDVDYNSCKPKPISSSLAGNEFDPEVHEPIYRKVEEKKDDNETLKNLIKKLVEENRALKYGRNLLIPTWTSVDIYIKTCQEYFNLMAAAELDFDATQKLNKIWREALEKHRKK